jgi:nucleoside-diphosphate-sugar epimerase
MKIVVIGGTGLIGSKVVACLDEDEYEALPASSDTGVERAEIRLEPLEGRYLVRDAWQTSVASVTQDHDNQGRSRND